MARQKAGYLVVGDSPVADGDFVTAGDAVLIGELTAGSSAPPPTPTTEDTATGKGETEAALEHSLRIIGPAAGLADLQAAKNALTKKVVFLVSVDKQSYTQITNVSITRAFEAGATESPALVSLVIDYSSKSGAAEDFYTRITSAVTLPAQAGA